MPFLCSALRTNFHFKTSELRVCGKLHPATVLLFAGQGAQFSGMGHDLWTAYPAITETAEAILGYSLPGLCLSNTDGRLKRTDYT